MEPTGVPAALRERLGEEVTAGLTLILSNDGPCVERRRAEGWPELPPSLRPEFLTMARTLGAVLRLTWLAGTSCPGTRRRAHPAAHVLLPSGDARGARTSDPGASWAPGPLDDSAVHAPEPSREGQCHSVARLASTICGQGRGYVEQREAEEQRPDLTGDKWWRRRESNPRNPLTLTQ